MTMEKTTIKKDNKYFDTLKMVCNAVSKESHMIRLNFVYVTEKEIVGCDGMRLAVMDNFGFDPGYYKIVKNTKTNITLELTDRSEKYPKYESLLIEKPADDDLSVFMGDDSTQISKLMYDLAKKGICINYEYLANFSNCLEYTTSGSKLYCYGLHNFTGVIMGIDTK